MKFTNTLIKGKLIKRYKRFFVDIKVNNSKITAHCPNTGSMMGLLEPGNAVFVSKNNDPKRKKLEKKVNESNFNRLRRIHWISFSKKIFGYELYSNWGR